MRVVKAVLKWTAAFAMFGIFLAGCWIYVWPPELFRVGAGYAAKIVCSNVFIAGRDPGQVLADDVQAPGHPLLKLMNVSVDHETRAVRVGLLGIFAERVAVARNGLGCTLLPDAGSDTLFDPTRALAPDSAAASMAPWPEGEGAPPANDPKVAQILGDDALTGPGMRAVVVVKDGRIVGERYAAGFSAETPLLGWSMTKTVLAAIIGTAVKDGKLSVDDAGLVPDWRGDDRANIKLADLLDMSSGLEFNEDYGDVTDVTRMLFLEPDMARFAAAKPLAHPVGTVFNYSSGTSLILSRILQDAVGDADTALRWPRERLFWPLGMRSAVLEADASGTYAGSSYLYATARDWARFGQFLLQDGVWNGEQILPAGFAAWMRTPAPTTPDYGKGHMWLRGPASNREQDAKMGMPADAYWVIGHDGQTIAILPSQKLIVVRLGLTPGKLGYKPQMQAAALGKAFAQD